MRLLIRHNGRDVTIGALARETGISHGALQARYNAGDRGDRLVRPVNNIHAGGREPTEEHQRLQRRLVPDPVFNRLLAQWNRLVAPWSVQDGKA